ncbi:nuclear transport factor 2 family protein [Enterococcus sp. 669A]|uniref:Nuclear transport factor 2 family protein n=1 Tax=Candidatus Enterococcus moelleringii TaxID=2815325 RepID=A0ABS3LG94_9ENTE|nr:nuclear transport factor 2 family protein [Enterococcus sp. 669A]MBO1308653.1 nuclear transport factor 2 family protein [Enterococcus sp. 669A]
MTTIEELAARLELKELVDRFAIESDENNLEAYREMFTADCQVKIYFNHQLGMDLNSIDELIEAFEGFGTPKDSFHFSGLQVVDFQDDTHASGQWYLLASLVDEVEGKELLTTNRVRCEDSYVKDAGQWRIAKREQNFVFSDTKELA